MSTAREDRRDLLWDQVVGNPAGITVNDMMDEHGWTMKQANEAIHDLRAYLGAYDDINLVCDPQGSGQRWLYRLVGSLDEVRDWTRNRVNDGETRVRTMQSMMSSVVSATSGRTTEGRKARIMAKALRRLVEDLDDLLVNVDGTTP